MYVVKKFYLDNNHKELSYKREMKKYDLTIKFENKSFGQRFVDYLRLTFFNSIRYEFLKKRYLEAKL